MTRSLAFLRLGLAALLAGAAVLAGATPAHASPARAATTVVGEGALATDASALGDLFGKKET